MKSKLGVVELHYVKIGKTYLFNLILHQVKQHFIMKNVFVKGTPFKDTNAFTIHFSQITEVNNFSFWKCQGFQIFFVAHYPFWKDLLHYFFKYWGSKNIWSFFFVGYFPKLPFNELFIASPNFFAMIKCFASTYFFKFIISLFLKMISTFPWLHYRAKMNN